MPPTILSIPVVTNGCDRPWLVVVDVSSHEAGAESAAASIDGVALDACGDPCSDGGERVSSAPSFSSAASALDNVSIWP